MMGRIRRIRRSIARTPRLIIKGGKAITQRVSGIGLFWSITAALAVGSALAIGAQWALHRFIRTSTAEAAPIDITKLSLTVVAGVGGVVALVVAYRRQRDLEQGRFVERFGAAAAQLGATDVAVRIAGVYAMAGVADESRGLRRQQCIDVLCGYLRLPYTPELGGNHQSKSVRKRRGRGGAGEHEDHFDYRQNDREVRATIVRVITAHLGNTAESSWSANEFDFQTAHFENADFREVSFSGDARFDGATFSGPTRFDRVTFRRDTWFDGATFSGLTWFEGATFHGDAWFDNAAFRGDTVWFDGATFSGDVWFDAVTFSGTAQFTDATFGGTAQFGDATFRGPTWFGGVTFSDTVWFTDATFASTTWFGGVTFSDSAWFSGVRFSGDVHFEKVDFGTGIVSFINPAQWGPPAPAFDWSDDTATKPANVDPQDWPPTPVPVAERRVARKGRARR